MKLKMPSEKIRYPVFDLQRMARKKPDAPAVEVAEEDEIAVP